ncbi:MAG: hypothetical protein HPY79_12495 [Bacteroidales bacterium]|nr:hypothetical protein [Bacteroidales bacterium]
MKKLFLLLLAGGIMITACKKDKEMPTNSVFNPHDDKAVEARIKAFNQSLQQKQGEPMTVNDAIWNIEAALNYNYCRTGLPQGLVSQDSLFIEMPVNDGTLSFTNVSEAYNQAASKIQSLLKNSNQHLVVIDVKPIQTTNYFKAKVYFMISNDDTNIAKDVHFTTAATQIKNYINSNMAALPNGGYYTNVETVEDVNPLTYPCCINTNWTGPYVNYYYYLMFYNYEGAPLYHTQLSSAEMSFYTNGTTTVMNTYTTSGGPRPVGKRIITINLWGDIITSIPTTILHRGNFTYGIPHSPSTN